MTNPTKTPAEIAAKLPKKVARRMRMIARRDDGSMPMDKREANGLVRRGLVRRQLDDYCRTEWGVVIARLAVVYLTDLGRAVAAESQIAVDLRTCRVCGQDAMGDDECRACGAVPCGVQS